MGRKAKLGEKNGKWFTKAGGAGEVYFGRVDEVSPKEADALFATYVRDLERDKRVAQSDGPFNVELFDAFLDAVKAKRGDRTYEERCCHLARYSAFVRNGVRLGDRPAGTAEDADLLAFQAHIEQHDLIDFVPRRGTLEPDEGGGPGKVWVRRAKPLDEWTVGKHQTSIMQCYAWGSGRAKLKNPAPCLPREFNPFANVDRIKRRADAKSEGDLPTAAEAAALLAHADDDLETIKENFRFRRRRPDEFRVGADNPYAGFVDILRVYLDTGPRTSELAKARVWNFQPASRTIVLPEHKRSTTQRKPRPRKIVLPAATYAIVLKRCEGKRPNDLIFADPKGRPWDRRTLCNRFAHVRARAGVRARITIYSFRHAWISEAVMDGTDLLSVADMAGTSVDMIERTYGHLRTDHLLEAQERLAAARAARAEGSGGSVGSGGQAA
ncbi:MAG: integrase [Phycisphaerales bacterium]|nr:integrase [Phycisphaerales bacterium]